MSPEAINKTAYLQAKPSGSFTLMQHQYKKSLATLKSKHFLQILSNIYQGYRPSQIAEQLGMSSQLLNYYTNNISSLALIEKIGNRKGIAWKLTNEGMFILKEILRRSVNNNNNNNNNNSNPHRCIPVRLHNVTFSFRIHLMDNNPRLRWNPINNGVAKCFIKYPNYILELTRSPYEGQSVLEVHLSEAYTFNPQQELIKQYDLARYYASVAYQRLKLNISDNGRLTKKPHYAFERDLIALYLATFQTANVTSVRGESKSWIDSSKGFGELETNDLDYTYKYLSMPENVMDIHESVKGIARKLSGYVSCNDPILTANN
jgi:hypothetical protein